MRADQQVEGNGGVAALHLRDARLARVDHPRERRLAQVPLLPAQPEAVGQTQAQLDVRALLVRQAEELLCGAEPPTLRFQPLALALTHHRIPSTVSGMPPTLPPASA